MKKNNISESKIAQKLDPFRNELDSINFEIVELLSKRMHICRTIAKVKSQEQIPMMQMGRVEFTLNKVKELAVAQQLRPEYVSDIFERIINETCDEESQIINTLSAEN